MNGPRWWLSDKRFRHNSCDAIKDEKNVSHKKVERKIPAASIDDHVFGGVAPRRKMYISYD